MTKVTDEYKKKLAEHFGVDVSELGFLPDMHSALAKIESYQNMAKKLLTADGYAVFALCNKGDNLFLLEGYKIKSDVLIQSMLITLVQDFGSSAVKKNLKVLKLHNEI